jgi:hypothetical protein
MSQRPLDHLAADRVAATQRSAIVDCVFRPSAHTVLCERAFGTRNAESGAASPRSAEQRETNGDPFGAAASDKPLVRTE